MPVTGTVVNLSEAVTARFFPAVTGWNRLEGYPRTHHFDRALRAEVRDALWMLTRQWQMGEFQGDDAGSPVLARVCTRSTLIDRYQAKQGEVEGFPLTEPLETKVERRPLPWRAGDQRLQFDLRAAVGRRWLKMLKGAFARNELSADYRDAYRGQYAITVPDPNLPADAAVCAHIEGWQQVSAMAERLMDGFALLEHVTVLGNHAADAVAAAPGDTAKLASLAEDLARWLKELLGQPNNSDQDAWLPRKLEYQFGCSAPLAGGDLVARADEYYQGHLDWYSIERTNETSLKGAPSGGAAPALHAQTFLPTQLVFAGMPNTRWWEFEDRKTNLGEVQPDTTDLGKLLLIEFGLVYANDWFVFPYTLPVGSINEVNGIAITNVFNERTWIEPASTLPTPGWQKWSMFQMTAPTEAPATLALLPAASQVLEGKSSEEIVLVRDEMANMVWGIEKRIALPSGVSKPGQEAAREYFRYLERIIGPPPAPPLSAAPVRYQVMNTVPENWIPFIPVHIAASSRETQLQRAAMLRLLGSDPNAFEKIRPRTMLLREGFPAAYFIDEEEVPRAGALICQAFQRTRWLGGKVFVWFGAWKSTGRGEGSSGLAFDLLAAKKD